MPKLSQETIAIVAVGATVVASIVALAAIVITLNGDMRAEGRADRADAQAAREAIRAEGRADREAWQAEMRALREDTGTDREAVSRISGIVEQMRTASR